MAVYLITGGSSGIGRGLAIEMAKRGHAVGIIARREELLKEVADEIAATGAKVAWAKADVTDAPQMTEAVRSIEAELGVVDVVLANAGGGGPMPVKKWSGETAKWVMKLNYEGTINTIDPVLPAMIERGSGHIAVVSSVAGYRGIPPGGPYSAAKSAVSVLFEALSVELWPRGIAVTSIHPGFIDTPIHGPDGAKHPTPFMISTDKAVQIIANGLERRRRFINFPFPMAAFMQFVRLIPSFIFEPLMYRTIPPKLRS